MFKGEKAGKNPWKANTLEWTAASPPPHGNWPEGLPNCYRGPYEYSVPGMEQDYLRQGEFENRTIEQTLELGWEVLSTMRKAPFGQSLLAGEPVGTMATAGADGLQEIPGSHANPMLYLEIRKDGEPIDPLPWLVVDNRKVRS